MKAGSKSRPSGKTTDQKQHSSEGMQTILSMFQRQINKKESDKCDSLKAQRDDSADEDDVIIVEKQETTSPYFEKQQVDSSKFEDTHKKTSLKRTSKSIYLIGKKKSKLSLSKATSKTPDSDTEFNRKGLVRVSEVEERFLLDSSEACDGKISKTNTNVTHLSAEIAQLQKVEDSEPCTSLHSFKSQSSEHTSTAFGPKVKNEAISSKLKHNTNSHSTADKSSFGSENKDPVVSESSVFESTETALSSSSSSSAVKANETNEEKVDDESEGAQGYTEPYYINNFETILEAVIGDDTNTQLFNEADMNAIGKYMSLSDAARKMYIRMFCRKWSWIPISKLNYPEIGEDLKPFLDELVQSGFTNDENDLTELGQVLEALSAADVKTLAKVYHIPPTISQKGQQVAELVKQTQSTNISDLFGSRGGHGGLAQSMLARAKKFLPSVYKLCGAPRAVFVRVMMLFSVVNTTVDEDSGIGGQGQLFQMLMVNMGKVVYPDYEVDKRQLIFGSRDDVLRFSEALQLESDLQMATERGKWDEAYSIFLTVNEKRKVLEADQNVNSWNKALPDYLRNFTAASVIYRLLSQGIEILQRRKDFNGAVDLLRTLLGQADYCCSHRGYWWERLALNLDAHLKKPEQSLEAVLSGLADPHVKVGHRLALYQRGQGICQRPRLKLGHRLQECSHPPVRELPKVHLEARVLHGTTGAGPRFLTRASYKREGDEDGEVGDLEVCGVEEFVLDHYRAHGFPSGIHAEGSVVTSLFALYFWDILFLPRPDAFQSLYQAMPLDLYTDSFYERRKEEIDVRLNELANSTVKDLQDKVEESWNQHEGTMCVGMGWDRMRSADCVKGLVSCMGAQVLSGLLKRYAHCPRHTRSGFPDLTLWNPTTGAFKICEVKGPGDRLSQKQILWINYLLELGVDAEVCHVKAVAAKRLLPSLS